MKNNVWSLPTSLTIGGVGYAIKTDFRDILKVLGVLSDPDAMTETKIIVMMKYLIEDFDSLPVDDYEEAINKIYEFIDCGERDDKKRNRPVLMDWEQDAPLIIPAVNKVLGQEIRAVPYLHWWTFVGAYMNISDGLFSSVVSIRVKKSKGKKLEKHEQEFYRENKSLIDIKRKETAEERAEKDALREMLGFKKR